MSEIDHDELIRISFISQVIDIKLKREKVANEAMNEEKETILPVGYHWPGTSLHEKRLFRL